MPGRIWHVAGQLAYWLRRPEPLVFLPAITLASFWIGGELALLAVSTAAPLLFMVGGAFRFRDPPPRSLIMGYHGLADEAALVARLDRTLARASVSGLQTACLQIRFEFDEANLPPDPAIRSEMIARSADRICAALRDGDLVARLGQDGLAIALAPQRRLDQEGLVQLAARIHAAVAPTISIGAQRFSLTCSTGICINADLPDMPGHNLLQAARMAAEEAQRHGPGGIEIYSRELPQQQAERTGLRQRLHNAFDRREICAHFQPRICAGTGLVTGFDTLARWHHPAHGVLPPSHFLKALTDSGLSLRLGEEMLRAGLSALAAWDKSGANVPRICISLSLADLRSPHLLQKIEWQLQSFGLAPSRLAVEITEEALQQPASDAAASNIARLAQLGCHVELGHFGTGPAGIANINRFALRRLKIDRRFVTGLQDDPGLQKTVAAIQALAEKLGLRTVALGVETSGEWQMLAAIGCAELQGEAIATPMPFEDSCRWLDEHRSSLGETEMSRHPP